MPKHYLKEILIFMLGTGLAGCGTGGSGVHLRSYVEERPRVNTEVTGNQGYLAGTPAPVDTSGKKKTRKVYVLEITKPADIPEAEEGLPSASVSDEPASSESTVDSSAYTDTSVLDSENTENLSSFVEYKVEKDDTLQKISKKFYDTYKKWPRIYEANKDKIKDPNHIKPGIVIKIPRE